MQLSHSLCSCLTLFHHFCCACLLFVFIFFLNFPRPVEEVWKYLPAAWWNRPLHQRVVLSSPMRLPLTGTPTTPHARVQRASEMHSNNNLIFKYSSFFVKGPALHYFFYMLIIWERIPNTIMSCAINYQNSTERKQYIWPTVLPQKYLIREAPSWHYWTANGVRLWQHNRLVFIILFVDLCVKYPFCSVEKQQKGRIYFLISENYIESVKTHFY